MKRAKRLSAAQHRVVHPVLRYDGALRHERRGRPLLLAARAVCHYTYRLAILVAQRADTAIAAFYARPRQWRRDIRCLRHEYAMNIIAMLALLPPLLSFVLRRLSLHCRMPLSPL